MPYPGFPQFLRLKVQSFVFFFFFFNLPPSRQNRKVLQSQSRVEFPLGAIIRGLLEETNILPKYDEQCVLFIQPQIYSKKCTKS